MSTELITVETPHPRDVSQEQFALIQIVGKALHASRYYASISTADGAAYLMARSYELGFPATAAPDVIDNIQGRLTLKPQAAWALVLRSGLLEDMKTTEGDDFCEILFKRRGLPGLHGYRFTLGDAQRADLVKTGGAWEKWTKNMLYWRAMGFAIDRVFPDVTIGLKDAPQFGGPIRQERVNMDTGEITVIDVGQEG
jgi:hypothetical protein